MASALCARMSRSLPGRCRAASCEWFPAYAMLASPGQVRIPGSGGFQLAEQNMVSEELLGWIAARRTGLAARAQRRGDWRRVARHYRAALRYRPRAAALWVQYGHALKESGRVGAAVGAYRRAIAL